MLTIYKAADIVEAQIVKGMLEANGIQAFVGGYYLQGAVGDISAIDIATVLINDHDEAEARPLIDAYESDRRDTTQPAAHTSGHLGPKPA